MSSSIQYNPSDPRQASMQASMQASTQKAEMQTSTQVLETVPNPDLADPNVDDGPDQTHVQGQRYFLERVEALKDVEKYPHKFPITIEIPEFINRYSSLTNDQTLMDKQHNMAGRIVTMRLASKKLFFFHINNNGQTLQIMVNAKFYSESAKHPMINLAKIICRSDIVGIKGFPTRTKTGELSLLAHEVILLAPCLHDIPASLIDKAIRYRHRHLDLQVNPDNRKIFITRNLIIQYIRNFLTNLNFVEIDTPMMHPIAGGASAKPFITHHNSLDMDLFMRIAPELYLKKALVGGFERVFEIGKQFRNESIDMTHNPEFTTCEFYWSYSDYNDLMIVTEQLITGMVNSICGSNVIEYNGKKIDFTPPYRRISMISELERLLETQFPSCSYDSPEMLSFLIDQCQKHKVIVPQPHTIGRVLDKLVGTFIEHNCVNPTFICDHPLIMSPLAKVHRTNPNLTERFELFIDGMEYCNSYTELNDPFDQKERFLKQLQAKNDGDDEAQDLDEDFINVLEYGLPPTGGWGCGIERLTMLLTNQPNIKEVILFPAMKPLIQMGK